MGPGFCASSTTSTGLLGRPGRRTLWSEFKILSQFYLRGAGAGRGALSQRLKAATPHPPGKSSEGSFLDFSGFLIRGLGSLASCRRLKMKWLNCTRASGWNQWPGQAGPSVWETFLPPPASAPDSPLSAQQSDGSLRKRTQNLPTPSLPTGPSVTGKRLPVLAAWPASAVTAASPPTAPQLPATGASFLLPEDARPFPGPSAPAGEHPRRECPPCAAPMAASPHHAAPALTAPPWKALYH